MNQVHIVLQSKGGVGKSLVASVIAQYKEEKTTLPLCIDTDSINNTFSSYKALEVQNINVMDSEGSINASFFDSFIETIVDAKKDVVIDSGSSSFVAFSTCLLSNNFVDVLLMHNYETVIHTIVTGGKALVDTVAGFAEAVEQFPKPARHVVWLNPFFGAVERNGKTFEEMKGYLDNKETLLAIVRLPELQKQTFGWDFEHMMQSNLTFREAGWDESLNLMVRHRLKMIQTKIFAQIDLAQII